MITRVEYYQLGNHPNGNTKTHQVVTYYLLGFIPIFRNKISRIDNELLPEVRTKLKKALDLI